MKKPTPPSIDQLIAGLAIEPIRAQEIMDFVHVGGPEMKQDKGQMGLFQSWIKSYAPELNPYLSQLAPSRMFIQSYKISCHTVIKTGRIRGFGIKVLPINASYQVIHRTSVAKNSRIEFEVQQFPLNSSIHKSES